MSESFFGVTIWVDALRFPVAFSHCSNVATGSYSFAPYSVKRNLTNGTGICVLYEGIDFVLFLHINGFYYSQHETKPTNDFLKSFAGQCLVNPPAGPNICARIVRAC